MRVLIGSACLAVAAVGLIVVGAMLMWRQSAMLAAAGTVTGQIQSVQPAKAGPRVVYHYQIGSVHYTRDQITPLPALMPRILPLTLAEDPAPGKALEIRVTPAGESFLLPIAQAYPSLLIWAGLCLGLATVIGLRRSGLLDAPPAPQPQQDSDWCRLTPTRAPVRAAVERWSESVAWMTLTFAAAGLYLFTASRPFDPAIAVAAAGLVPAGMGALRAWRWGRLAAVLAEIELTTMKDHVALDRPVLARATMRVRRPVALREARLALVCRRRCGLASQKLYFNSVRLVGERALTPQAPAFERAGFEVPRCKRRGSSRFDRFRFPRIEWCFELHLHLHRGGCHVMRFPVRAVPAVPAQPTLQLANAIVAA